MCTHSSINIEIMLRIVIMMMVVNVIMVLVTAYYFSS